MALLPTMYNPLVTPDTIASLLPRAEYQGGPAQITMPSAPPIMDMRAPQVMPTQQVPAPAPTPTPTPAPAPTPTPTPAPALENFDPQALLNLTSQILQPKLDYDPANVVYFDTGGKVGVPDPATGKMVKRNAGPVVFQPGETYTMRDRQGNVIATATTLEELQKLAALSEEVPGYVLDKPEYVGMYKTGTTEKVPDDLGFFGTALDVGLPVLGAIAAGPLAPLGAAAGSGLASAAQGRSLKNTLLRAGLTAAGTAAGGSLLGEGASGSVTEGLLETGGILPTTGGPFSATLGSTAGSTAGSALPAVGPSIIVSGTVPAATSAATGSALGSAAGTGLGSVATNVVSPQPTGEPSIEVVGKRIPSPSIFERAVEPFASGVANALGPDFIPTTEGEPIIVEETRSPVDEGTPENLLPPEYAAIPAAGVGATVGAGVPTTEGEPITVTGSPENLLPPEYAAIPAAGVGAATLTPGMASGEGVLDEYTGLEGGKNSLLDEIIKYYSLGSIGLDALGGALGLGGGGGGGQAAAPYVSQLGPMPTFTRGGFQPYTGDYETYGFGPEFNFFGGPAPITPTAPAMGVLGPNTPVDTTLI